MFKTVAISFLAIFLISVLFSAPAFADPEELSTSDWATFRGGILRTGFSPCKAPDTNSLGWSKAIPGAGDFWSSPAVVGDRLYIGSQDGYMYCLDAVAGDIIWKFHAGTQAVYSAPTVAYGLVFFGAPEHQMFALPCDDPNSDGTIDNSEIAWNYTFGPSTGGVNDVVCSSPAVKDGLLFIGAVDQYMYCFNATNGGTPLWKSYTPFPGQHAFSSSPALADNFVIAGTGKQPGGTSGGRLYAFNTSTGARAWEFDINDITYSTPAVMDGRVYIANSGDWIIAGGNKTYKIFCLDLDGFLDGTDDGTVDTHYGNSDLIWSYNTGKYVYSSPAAYNGRIYFGCQNGNLTCLDAATGAVIWICNTPPGGSSEAGGIMGSPAIADGKVFFGTQDSKIIAVPVNDPNMDGGISPSEYVWSYTLGTNKIVSSPAVANGAVYIGGDAGKVYCFGTPIVPENIMTIPGFLTGVAIGFVAIIAIRRRN